MRVLLCFALLALAAGYKTYQGYQVLRAHPRNKEESLYLNEQTIWEAVHTSDGVDLYVPPQYRVAARGLLSDIVFEVNIENLGDLIEVEKRRLAKKKAFDLNDYNTYEDIMDELPNYLTLCASNGLTCAINTIGSSSESRAINVLSVSSGGGSKPAVYIDSLTHAREWLAGATLLNIMDNVIRQGDADAVRLLASYDFYFGPVMNPDGYTYTFSNERLWRKNRAVNSGTTCRGTDLNRNFDASYRRAGTSNNPCSDTYHGSGAASEVETQAIQAYLDSVADLVVVISIHSYGRMYLHPVGYDTNNCQRAPSADHNRMYAGATAAANAIMQTGGQTWTWGTVCETIYAATGATIDYAYENTGVIYSYTPEVRGNSFIAAPSEIGPSYREMWAGTIALIDSMY